LNFVHTDHLNTPRLIADEQQRTVWRWDHTDPFGGNPPDENPSGLGNFEFPLRFPGQYSDKETNLRYNYFRDYDPSLGRYAESDPIGLRGGINTYAYSGSSPLLYIDPDGLLSCWYSIYSATLNCTNNAGQSFTSSAAASGTLECRDNPQCVSQPFKGPIPPGLYTIKPPGWSQRRPRWLYLDPASSNTMSGRSGFFIHPWGLSAGCITLHIPDFTTITNWARQDGGGTLGVTD